MVGGGPYEWVEVSGSLSFLALLWMTPCQNGPAELWPSHSALDGNRPEVPKHYGSLEALKNTDAWFPHLHILIYGCDRVNGSFKSSVGDSNLQYVIGIGLSRGLLAQTGFERPQEGKSRRK